MRYSYYPLISWMTRWTCAHHSIAVLSTSCHDQLWQFQNPHLFAAQNQKLHIVLSAFRPYNLESVAIHVAAGITCLFLDKVSDDLQFSIERQLRITYATCIHDRNKLYENWMKLAAITCMLTSKDTDELCNYIRAHKLSANDERKKWMKEKKKKRKCQRLASTHDTWNNPIYNFVVVSSVHRLIKYISCKWQINATAAHFFSLFLCLASFASSSPHVRICAQL